LASAGSLAFPVVPCLFDQVTEKLFMRLQVLLGYPDPVTDLPGAVIQGLKTGSYQKGIGFVSTGYLWLTGYGVLLGTEGQISISTPWSESSRALRHKRMAGSGPSEECQL